MFTAVVLILGALATSTNAAVLSSYGYPDFYSAAPWAAPAGFYRTQYHTQANYAPVTYAAPLAYAAPVPAASAAYYTAAAAAPVAVKAYAPAYASNQYHSQNHLGEAAYGYSFPGQAHSAVRDAFGGVTGSYSYIGAEGKPVQVNYRADSANGFQVSSNILPVAPKVDLVQPANDLQGPEPVDFTPEVKAAREEHLKAVEAAKAQPGYKAGGEESTSSSRKKRSVVAFYAGGVPAAGPYFGNFGYAGYPAAAHPAAAYYPSFYSAAAIPPAYGYGYPGAPLAAVVKTEIKPLKAVEGTPASTYKFELE